MKKNISKLKQSSTIIILSFLGQFAYANMGAGVGVQGKIALAQEEIQEFELTKQAEQVLKNAGYNIEKVDGVTQDSERKVIYTYQRDQGLPLTGEYDAETLDSLNITYEL